MKMFITFPQRLNTRNCYTIYEGADEEDIRHQILADHGQRWAFMYPIEKLGEQIKEFGLTELPRPRSYQGD